MMENIKQNLFTLHGLVTSVVHAFVFVGAISSWIYFQVSVLGHDVTIPSATSSKR